jgi:hypothetical protein
MTSRFLIGPFSAFPAWSSEIACMPVKAGFDRGCVKTIDDSFIGAKHRVLVERGSILGEFLEHESSESNSANLVSSFHTASTRSGP